MIRDKASFSFSTRRFGTYYYLKIVVLLLITAAATWFGKGNHSLFSGMSPELAVYIKEGVPLLCYTAFSHKKEHSTIVIPIKEPIPDFSEPFNPRKHSWDLISLSTAIPRLNFTEPPKNWYTLPTAHRNQYTVPPLCPPPTSLSQPPLHRYLKALDTSPDTNAIVITLGRIRILYAASGTNSEDIFNRPFPLKEQFDLLIIRASNDTSSMHRLHRLIRPYYTIIINPPESAIFSETNIIVINQCINRTVLFTEDKNGILSLK